MDKIVIANKSDQIEKRKVSYDEGYSFSKMHGLEFLEVSAMSSSNIAAAFEVMARKILIRLDATPLSSQKIPTTQLEQRKTIKKN